MARFKIECNCGWIIETNDKDTLNVACTTHDKTCPAKPDCPTHAQTNRCGCGGTLPCPYKTLPQDQQQPAIIDGGHG